MTNDQSAAGRYTYACEIVKFEVWSMQKEDADVPAEEPKGVLVSGWISTN